MIKKKRAKPEIKFITSSPGKFKEVQAFLGSAGIKVKQVKLDLEELQEIDSRRVMEHKVRQAKKKGHKDFLIEDSSLTIHGMGKLPGPLTKWFQKELGNEGTYLMATRVGKGAAEATTIFARVKKGKVEYFAGVTKGHIVSPRGENGFGWDKIFRPEGSHQTFAEMEWEEKARWSMRVKALKRLRQMLLKEG